MVLIRNHNMQNSEFLKDVVPSAYFNIFGNVIFTGKFPCEHFNYNRIKEFARFVLATSAFFTGLIWSNMMSVFYILEANDDHLSAEMLTLNFHCL